MYMEEQLIEGVLCVRYSPDDDFKPYTLLDLSQRVIRAEKRLADIRGIVN
jgi:hypothetical protein